MRWTIHLEGGPDKVNNTAVAIGEQIFSFGGYCTGDNYEDEQPIDVFVLNTLTYRWTEIPKPAEDDPSLADWPYQRYGHTVIAYADSIYLFGGKNDEAACNVLFKFDTNTYKWSKRKVHGEIPGPRDGHSACVIGEFMYVLGGYEEITQSFEQDVYRLDLTSYTWKLLVCIGEPPVHWDFNSATAIGSNIFIFGGRQGSNKVCYFDTSSLTWHKPNIQPPLPSARRSHHSALNLDGKLLIFGGYNWRNKEHKNDIWLLDPETWTWEQVKTYGNGPNPRRSQALCRVGDRILLFGGTSTRPYYGPPHWFDPGQTGYFLTPGQLAFYPKQEEDSSWKLMQHNDLFVLDLTPSLKTLALLSVIQNRLNTNGLPKTLLNEIHFMSTHSNLEENSSFSSLLGKDDEIEFF